MSVLSEAKPSQIRKYLFEYALIALTGAVALLFVMIINLNTYIRKDLTEQKIKTEATILKNNEVIRELINSYKK